MKGNIDKVRELSALDDQEKHGILTPQEAMERRIMIKTEEDPTYLGSERHFQDLQKAAGKSTADQREPENLSEALDDLADGFLEFLEALGFFRFCDRVLVAIGKFLIKVRGNV